jgi:hypothetical protein
MVRRTNFIFPWAKLMTENRFLIFACACAA